jgi:two-component system nitrate/nitrite response regulator NarL
LEVLRHVAHGSSQKEIAITLDLSPETVHMHTANPMKKLQVHSRVELATFAIREGLIAG